tara:strand:+ start:2568 stop:4214 length:1647 start_codon:yes stop_codon:yes gene_type:complete
MTSKEDREIAERALLSAFDNAGQNPEEWLQDLVYGGAEEESFTDDFVTRREVVGGALGWPSPGYRRIPSNSTIRFLVDFIESDLLALAGVRKVLGEHLLASDPRVFHGLIADHFDGNSSTGDDIGDFLSIPLKMNGSFAKSLCQLSGIPISYASKGTVDQREPHLTVNMPKPIFPLRDFQTRIVEKLWITMEERNGRAIVCMPTGSGKTRTTSEAALTHAISRLSWPFSILWVADRDELCEQAVQTMISVYQDLGIREEGRIDSAESLDVWRYFHAMDAFATPTQNGPIVPGVTVTSVQQFRRRIESGDRAAEALVESSDLVIVDEAHRNLDWLEEFDDRLRSGASKPAMIGLTATPMRLQTLETTRLAKVFDQTYSPIEGGANDSRVMLRGMKEMGIISEREDLPYDDLVRGASQDNEALLSIIEGLFDRGRKSILVFTESVEQAQEISSILRMSEEPVNAEYLDHHTPFVSRSRIISGFREGGIQVLLNFGILTTGFDAPKTDAVVIARKNIDPESSLFIQMVGRGLRGPEFGGTESCSIVHYRGI